MTRPILPESEHRGIPPLVGERGDPQKHHGQTAFLAILRNILMAFSQEVPLSPDLAEKILGSRQGSVSDPQEKLLRHLLDHLYHGQSWPYDQEELQGIIGPLLQGTPPAEIQFLLGLSLAVLQDHQESMENEAPTPLHQFLHWTSDRELMTSHAEEILSILRFFLAAVEGPWESGEEEEVGTRDQALPGTQGPFVSQEKLLAAIGHILQYPLTGQSGESVISQWQNELKVLDRWIGSWDQRKHDLVQAQMRNSLRSLVIMLRRILKAKFNPLEINLQPYLADWSRKFPLLTWTLWQVHPLPYFTRADKKDKKVDLTPERRADFWRDYLLESRDRNMSGTVFGETLQRNIQLLKLAFSLVPRKGDASQVGRALFVVKDLMEDLLALLERGQGANEFQSPEVLGKIELRLIRFYSQTLLSHDFLQADQLSLLSTFAQRDPRDFYTGYALILSAYKNERKDILIKLQKKASEREKEREKEGDRDKKEAWERFSPQVFVRHLFAAGSKVTLLKNLRAHFYDGLDDRDKHQVFVELTQYQFLIKAKGDHEGAQLSHLTNFYKVFLEDWHRIQEKRWRKADAGRSPDEMEGQGLGDPHLISTNPSEVYADFHLSFGRYLLKGDWPRTGPLQIKNMVEDALNLHAQTQNNEIKEALGKFLQYVFQYLSQEHDKAPGDGLIPMPAMGKGIFSPHYPFYFLLALEGELARKWQEKLIGQIKAYFKLFLTTLKGTANDSQDALWESIFIRMKEIFPLNKVAQTAIQEMKGQLVFGQLGGQDKRKGPATTQQGEQLSLWS